MPVQGDTLWSVIDFETMVRRGLGRAVLYARQNDISTHRDFLLHACLHNIAHDPQLEGTRSEFMYDIIRASGDVEFYAGHVREALENIETEENPWTQLEIAAWLGWAGDEKTRQALRNVLIKFPASSFSSHATEEIVSMDGLEGLVFVFQQLVSNELDETATGSCWYLGAILDQVIEDTGEEKTRFALDQVINDNPRLAPIVKAAYAIQIARKALPYPHIPPPVLTDYDEIKAAIVGASGIKIYPKLMNKWGAALDDATARRLAQDLLEETDVKRLRFYVGLFGERSFPLPYQRLFELIVSPNPDSWRDWPDSWLIWLTYDALAQIKALDVRALALELIDNVKKPHFGVDLLLSNYQDGDWKRLAELVERDLAPDVTAWVAHATHQLFQKYPSPDAYQMLLTLYEKCPSISGRLYYVIDNLQELGPLPDWMIEECRYDAYQRTREFAAGLAVRDSSAHSK